MTVTANVSGYESPDLVRKRKFYKHVNGKLKSINEKEKKLLEMLLMNEMTLTDLNKFKSKQIIDESVTLLDSYFMEYEEEDHPWQEFYQMIVGGMKQSINSITDIPNAMIDKTKNLIKKLNYKVYLYFGGPPEEYNKKVPPDQRIVNFKGFRVTKKTYKELYSKMQKDRFYLIRNVRRFMSYTLGAAEDLDKTHLLRRLVTLFKIFRANIIKAIDFGFAYIHMILRNRIGEPSSKAYILRRVGAYADLSEAIFDTTFMLFGTLAGIAVFGKVAKIIIAAIKKLMPIITKIIKYTSKVLLNILKFGLSVLKIILRILPLSKKNKKRYIDFLTKKQEKIKLILRAMNETPPPPPPDEFSGEEF